MNTNSYDPTTNKLRCFDDDDWSAFAGCEELPGQPPHTGDFTIIGFKDYDTIDAMVVADVAGVQVVLSLNDVSDPEEPNTYAMWFESRNYRNNLFIAESICRMAVCDIDVLQTVYPFGVMEAM